MTFLPPWPWKIRGKKINIAEQKVFTINNFFLLDYLRCLGDTLSNKKLEQKIHLQICHTKVHKTTKKVFWAIFGFYW